MSRAVPPRVMSMAVIAGATMLWSAPASSKSPEGPVGFCQTYPDAPACTAGATDCTMCHGGFPGFNPYGAAVDLALNPGQPGRTSGSPARFPSAADFAAMLPGALAAIESQDADGDGFSNIDEIRAGTRPGDANSKPDAGGVCPPAVPNPRYDVCQYDAAFALQKVSLDFCGHRVDYETLDAFRKLDAGAQDAQIISTLQRCLDTDFWAGRDGVLWRLGHAKIRPLASIKSGEGGSGPIQLGDYLADYHLFVYTQTDDRDARDVLTAQYFVSLQSGTEPVSRRYVRLTGDQPSDVWDQSVPEARRAGLITSDWFLVFNTMFSAIPRTSAAVAYRAYLGLDIAKSEGLVGNEIPGEPVDYDKRGVTVAPCNGCHSVLDPLSYPFATYNGLGGATTYDPDRISTLGIFEDLVDQSDVEDTPENGYIFGQPVQDLVEWARVAADSDAFAMAMVADHWRNVIGEAPAVTDTEYERLWKDFKSPDKHNYRVEKMLEALVRTEAYGVP